MEIIPTTIQHILEISENITNEDLNEFKKYKTYVLKDESISLLEHLVMASCDYEIYTMIHNSVVMALGGELNGCVWFLTSNYLGQQTKEIKNEFITIMNEHKEKVLDETGYIWNFIWEGNKTHINFLKMMGAEFPVVKEEIPEEFKLFIIRRK